MTLLPAQAVQERAGQGGRVLSEVVGDPGQVSGRQPPAPGRLPGGVGVGGQEDDGGGVGLLHAPLPQQRRQTPGVPEQPPLPEPARLGLGCGAGALSVHGEHDIHEQGVHPAGYLLGSRRVVRGVGLEDGGQEPAEPHPLGRDHGVTAVEGVAPDQDRACRAVPLPPADPRLLQALAPGPAVPVGVGGVRGRQEQATDGAVPEGGDLQQDLGVAVVDDVVDGTVVQARVNRLERQQRPVDEVADYRFGHGILLASSIVVIGSPRAPCRFLRDEG